MVSLISLILLKGYLTLRDATFSLRVCLSMVVPWKSPGSVSTLNKSTYCWDKWQHKLPPQKQNDFCARHRFFIWSPVYNVQTYDLEIEGEERREGCKVGAFCNPSRPPLLSQQPVNPGTYIPFWKNHMQFNSWEFAEHFHWFSPTEVKLTETTEALRERGESRWILTLCLTKKPHPTPQWPGHRNLSSTLIMKGRIHSLTLKNVKKKKIKIKC